MTFLIQSALILLAIYLAVGVAIGIAFVVRGVDLVDPAMRGSPGIVRLVILPGSAALWPVMLAKWMRARRGAPIDHHGSDHAS